MKLFIYFTIMVLVNIITSPLFANTLTYSLVNSNFGNIGVYVNTITYKSPYTAVHTETHLDAKLFGVTVYHEDSSRNEIWKNNHLQIYEGINHINDKTVEIRGGSSGDKFVFSLPNYIVANGDIRPENIWNENISGTTSMFFTDSGQIVPTRVIGPTNDIINSVSAHEYAIIAGNFIFTVWFVNQIPVKIIIRDNSRGGETTTFSLTSNVN
jgi:hypothetical protein